MEDVSRILLDQFMPKGHSTVGYHIDVYHLKPAPLESTIEVTAEVIKQEGRKVKLKVEARLGETLIG